MLYGIRGSGKTYTLLGESENRLKEGIIPRAMNRIFEFIYENPQSLIYATYTMVYNEKLYDLVGDPERRGIGEPLSKETGNPTFSVIF